MKIESNIARTETNEARSPKLDFRFLGLVRYPIFVYSSIMDALKHRSKMYIYIHIYYIRSRDRWTIFRNFFFDFRSIARTRVISRVVSNGSIDNILYRTWILWIGSRLRPKVRAFGPKKKKKKENLVFKEK